MLLPAEGSELGLGWGDEAPVSKMQGVAHLQSFACTPRALRAGASPSIPAMDQQNCSFYSRERESNPGWCGSVIWSIILWLKVVSLIPSQAKMVQSKMYLGCRFDPQPRQIWSPVRASAIPNLTTYDSRSRHVQEATNRCFSLTSMFLSLPYSLFKKQWKNVLRWGFFKKRKWKIK